MNGRKKVDSRLPRRLRLIHADFIELDLNIQIFNWIECLMEGPQSGKRKSSSEKGRWRRFGDRFGRRSPFSEPNFTSLR